MKKSWIYTKSSALYKDAAHIFFKKNLTYSESINYQSVYVLKDSFRKISAPTAYFENNW